MNQPPAGEQPREEGWQVQFLGPRIPWNEKPVRPADLAEELCRLMLSRENVLEDANYQKIAPNRFIVEISLENYARNYQPLEEQILRQWNDKILGQLLTANSRQGRQEYRFVGPVKIELRPAPDLRNSQARILSRVQSGLSGFQPESQPLLRACLESLPDQRRWSLRLGLQTIGRNPGCDIHLDSPSIQQKKLVSSWHACLYCQEGNYRLVDGSPDGSPSLNGTFVNQRRLPSGGIQLKDGDLILLAALDPDHPSPDTPGTAALRFHLVCS